MYNLASVLEEHKLSTDIIPYNLNLKKDMEHLEKEYLDASKQNVSIVSENFMKFIFMKYFTKNVFFYFKHYVSII